MVVHFYSTVSELLSLPTNELVELDQKWMDYSWKKSEWDSWLSGSTQKLITTISNSSEVLIGFCLFEFDAGQWSHLYKIAISGDERRKGAASSILSKSLAYLEQFADTCTLEVNIKNSAAIGLYEALGFRSVGERKSFYSDGATALKMIYATS